jgi:hypothetical protein
MISGKLKRGNAQPPTFKSRGVCPSAISESFLVNYMQYNDMLYYNTLHLTRT